MENMASDSSASTTPMVLTPESTGTSPDSSAATKKARRQTAFYPNLNSSNKPLKPFSRSAAKRESVMALGSIEHLQHYFTKTGIAAKRNPLAKSVRGLVPAIGGLSHIRTSQSVGSEFELPPSPAAPAPPIPPIPHIKTSHDAESLLPGVIADLEAVAHIWQTDTTSPSRANNNSDAHSHTHLSVESATGSAGSSSFDVLESLKTTTRTIRSIRNYLLSLPDESTGTIRANFRPKLLGPAGKTQSNSTNLHPSSSSNTQQPDPLSLIRKSALEVLAALHAIEERYRLPLMDDAYDVQSEGVEGGGGGGDLHSRRASSSNSPIFTNSPSNNLEGLPAVEDELLEGLGASSDGDGGHHLESGSHAAFSLVQVQGRYQPVPVWEDSEDEFEQGDDVKEKRERWDERLVVGSGWLYRQDVTLKDLEKERAVVAAYLDVVDEVLFEWKGEGVKKERGWERERQKALGKLGRGVIRAKARRVSADASGSRGIGLLPPADDGRRRVSTGMLSSFGTMSLNEEPEEMEDIQEDADEELSADDEELPLWAQRTSFNDDNLGRAYAMLSSFLPSTLLSTLGPSTSRNEFLTSLSSGQLLCVAYNTCIRKSKYPWGYVSRDSIHDIVALEEAERESGKAGEGGKKGWTFRRTDNLRLWAGALKLRYMLPIHVPSQSVIQVSGRGGTPAGGGTPLGSPIRTAHRTAEFPIVFDAKVVAKKEDGWEDMLEAVLFKWVEKAVDEKRHVGR